MNKRRALALSNPRRSSGFINLDLSIPSKPPIPAIKEDVELVCCLFVSFLKILSNGINQLCVNHLSKKKKKEKKRKDYDQTFPTANWFSEKTYIVK